ncbi:MAG: hypothetical protein BA869_08855 [Desulfuromonadales bacterium C00003107]|nr:MAG: hypothetical protein BA869_08855 [Desulfuromonadales bacterium C00003107]
MGKICVIIGTRPEIIKMSPVVLACERQEGSDWFVLHTGQHYSYGMDRVFFEQPGLPVAGYDPDVRSNTLAGTEPERIFEGARIMLNSKMNWRNPFGDGEAGAEIVEILIDEKIRLINDMVSNLRKT